MLSVLSTLLVILSARASSVQRRDSATAFTLQGCYTDTSTSRTLASASFTSTTAMTVESCLAFCANDGYNLAGVEFGSQCYCDYALQDSGTLSSSGNCNMPCSGNSTELCGAGDFIDVYWNGKSPVVPETVGSWQYEGCFADSVSSRALPHQQFISAGVTIESCAAACKSAGFAVAGLEFGEECWCNSALPTSAQLNGNDCHTACAANTTEFCGGPSKLTVYAEAGGQTCLGNTLSAGFNLEAVFVSPPTGATSVPLHVILINTVTLVSWDILSTASGVFTSEQLTNGGLLPLSASQPNFRTTSLAVITGDSPTFVTTEFPPTSPNAYCIMSNPFVAGGPQVLAVNSRSDLWALCPNNTAAGRVDVVWSPIAGHPHYNLSSCESVYITFTS